MNDQPSNEPAPQPPRRASRGGRCSRVSRPMPTPAAKPAMPIPISARLRLLIQDPAEGLAGQLALGDEAARAAALDERPEVRARRGSRSGRSPGAEPFSVRRSATSKPVDVGQVHVEERPASGLHASAAWSASAPVPASRDHLEALGLEHPARAGAEARVVVDDQHLHAVKSGRLRRSFRHTGNRTIRRQLSALERALPGASLWPCNPRPPQEGSTCKPRESRPVRVAGAQRTARRPSGDGSRLW